MASVSATFRFGKQAPSGWEVSQDFDDIVNYINNRNDGTTTWDAVYASSSTINPVMKISNSTGTNNIANFQDNATNVFTIADGGVSVFTANGGSGVALTANNGSSTGAAFVCQDNTTVVFSVGDGGVSSFTANGGSGIALTINGGTSTGLALRIQDNGTNMHTFADGGAVVLNENGNDADIRMEGDAEVNLFFLDASADRVGIGTATPGSIFDVVGSSTTLLTMGAWTDWTPTYTGYTGAVTTNVGRYVRIGKTICFELDFTGTSNATTLTFTLPVAALATISTIGGACIDNGAAQNTPPRIDVGAASTTVTVYKSFDGTAWTNSGTKSLRLSFVYEGS